MASNLSSRIVLAALAATVVPHLSACSSRKEAAEARASLYDAEFAVVYTAVVAAVRDLYPNYDDNPAAGKVSTVWHQVKFTDPGADDPKSQAQSDRAQGLGEATSAGGGAAGLQPNRVRRLDFIRFDVLVSGGRPWRVKVHGTAARLEPGNAMPSELRGADEPHWLVGRSEELLVKIHRKLKPYAMKAPVEIEAVAVDVPPPATVVGDMPEPARATAIAVVTAIRLRDPAALRGHLAADVRWSLGAPPGVDGAMAMWQADPATLTAMAAAIEAGCGTIGTEIQCPSVPAAGAPRVRLAERNGGWRLISFLTE